MISPGPLFLNGEVPQAPGLDLESKGCFRTRHVSLVALRIPARKNLTEHITSKASDTTYSPNGPWLKAPCLLPLVVADLDRRLGRQMKTCLLNLCIRLLSRSGCRAC